MSVAPRISKIESIGISAYENYPQVERFTHEPQAPRPQDVDILIEACGICGSDVHAAKGDWGKPYVPLAVGHEIIGKIVAVGEDVDPKKFKIGDRVGVGAQADCCNECYRCKHGFQNNCRDQVGTYLGVYKKTETPSQGGYSSHIRLSNKNVFKIPDALNSEHAAPLLCGGITGFKPLLDAGVTKGTKVGVNGIGGIGHMTILFAKALGAEVTAISRSDKKKGIASKLGADHYIATNEEDVATKHFDSLDLIVNTASDFSQDAMKSMVNFLKPLGTLTFITAPPIGVKVEIDPFTFLFNNIKIGGSAIGAPREIEYMLKVAAEHDIRPWVETLDINEENVTKAWNRMDSGDIKFRFVLTGYDKCFK